MERKKWHSVRSYLCGDEYNLVLAEEDAASVRSSEATVTQPVQEIEVSTQKQDPEAEVLDISSQLKRREQAALIIQSAFRSFLVILTLLLHTKHSDPRTFGSDFV